MKKIILVLLLTFITLLTNETVAASEYLTYQDISFEVSGMRLLEDWPNSDYKKFYKKIKKRRFWGWRTYTAYDSEKAYFVKDTLYIIENEGESPIIETLEFKLKESTKKQYGVTGDLGLETSGKKNGFKLNLESKIEGHYNVTDTTSREEEVTIKISVDQYTRLTIQIEGEGKVTNGVAKYYRFFKEVKKGGFEIFIVTTEYYSILKEKIDEE